MKIVGISGYATAGKDTLGLALADYGYQRFGFADIMKEAAYALDTPVRMYDGAWSSVQPLVDAYGWDKAKKMFPDIRRLLQRLGTEVGRNLFGQDFWVEHTMAAIDKAGLDKAVITDCRFANEAQAVAGRDGLVVRVTRAGVGPANDHVSEIGLDDWPFDVVVTNDGEIRDLDQWAQFIDQGVGAMLQAATYLR